ncbi:MAG: HD-GYP domain-containing protein [Burkholderiales bacterium]
MSAVAVETPLGNEANPQALDAIVKASETYSIVASEDIVDVRGLKLWAKGQPVSKALQQRLLERKLQRPLEVCLTAEDGVTLFGLHDDLTTWLDDNSHPMATALRPWAKPLLEQVKRLPLHSVAQLLLTAALATRPATLPHAVAAMAMAGAMMLSKNRSAVDVRMAMLGGLMHDLGEVYIQPQYLDHSSPLDLVGHKHLVVHPRVAQLLLRSTTDYPESLCRAIGEHHERLDGSGYPARLVGDKVSELGRILAVVEVALGIFRVGSAPLTRASFALRVVPGEFDPQWTALICDAARLSAQDAPQNNESTAPPLLPLTVIEHHIQQAQQLAQALQAQGRSGAVLEVITNATTRLTRLQVAWNALGCWGLGDAALNPGERFELEMADRELKQRLRELQRECMLLSERLGEAEKLRLQPLWQDLIPA